MRQIHRRIFRLGCLLHAYWAIFFLSRVLKCNHDTRKFKQRAIVEYMFSSNFIQDFNIDILLLLNNYKGFVKTFGEYFLQNIESKGALIYSLKLSFLIVDDLTDILGYSSASRGR